MTAFRAMFMRRIMSAGAVLRGAAIRICGSDFDHVFLNTAVIHMLQVTVVEVIDVPLMPNRDVTTVRSVDVLIGAMGMVRGGHASSFPDYSDSGLIGASETGNDRARSFLRRDFIGLTTPPRAERLCLPSKRDRGEP
jgi:uncharacterized membrane protein